MPNIIERRNLFPHPDYPAGPVYIANSEEQDVSFARYAKALRTHRWLIALILLFAVFIAGLYIVASRPTYEANFLIHVEEDGGKRDLKTMYGETATMFNMKTTSSGEIELVKSRLVVSQALEKLNIYVSAEPEYFPVVGRWLALSNVSWSAPEFFKFRRFSWGQDKIHVSSFMVPDDLLNTEFKVIAREKGTFTLTDVKGAVVAEGQVGVPLEVLYDTGQLRLLISSLEATPGVHFRLTRSSKLALIEWVQANLTAVEQGKQSAVIKVALRGDNPHLVSQILSEIARQYVAQNSARKNQEATTALTLLNKQLPELKQQLEDSEMKYNSYRNSKGTIDLAEEARSDLQQLSIAKSRKMEIELKRTELAARFTPNHPIMESLDTQLKDVNKDIRKLSEHIKSLPLMEQELLKLSREMRVNTELYTSLLNTARQLRLVTVSSTTNVRLVDMPMVPEKPVSATPTKILGIGMLAGLLAGIAAAILKSSLQDGIEDSVEVEQAIDLPVFAVVPYSITQQILGGKGIMRKGSIPLLAKEAPFDHAIEGLRKFRAVLQFSPGLRTNNAVLITSPTEGNGKSFMTANLAVLLGSGNKRVLVIDSDLRKGDLHRYFGVEQDFGLAESLLGAGNINTYIHRSISANVDFISSGRLPCDPEILMRPSLKCMLDRLSKQYDIVLVNGAPLLEVSDALPIGACTGSIYIVARAGVSTQDEIAAAVKILRQAGLSVTGCLLNGVKTRRRHEYAYRYGYGKSWAGSTVYQSVPGSNLVAKR